VTARKPQTSQQIENERLRRELAQLHEQDGVLRLRLEEAEQALEAIRTGQVESLVIEGPEGPRIFSLEGSSHSYRLLVEAMSEGAATLNEGGTILYCNARFARLLRVPLERVMGSNIHDWISESCQSTFEALLREAAVTEGRSELSLRDEGGGEVPVYLSMSGWLDDSLRRFCMVATDLREQKRIEEIVEAERLVRSVLGHTADVIVVCDRSGRIVRASASAEVLAGANPLLRPFGDVFPLQFASGPDQDGVRACGAVEEAIGGKEFREVAATMRRPDGSGAEVYVSATALRGAGNSVLGCVVLLVDITQRKQFERLALEGLEEQRHHALEASRLKSEFLSIMSHELRTPIGAVMSFAQLLQHGLAGPVSEEQKELLGEILGAGTELLSLVGDILDLAKIEAGKVEFVPEPVAPALVAQQVVHVLRGVAAARRLTLEMSNDPAVPEVVVDRGKLKQVFYNFVSNAIKFTAPGGHVTVRILPAGAENFRIEVEDDGIGIRAEDLGRLFTEFQQLAGCLGEPRQGTGLGLALVRRLVEAQGGQVGVRSVLGEGSLFFAILPRRPETGEGRSGACRTAGSPILLPAAKAPVVLVVEDDPLGRDWLTRLLPSKGYGVQTAATGALAVQLARSYSFDAVAFDLLLEDMTATEMARELRVAGANPDAPLLLVLEAAEKGLTAGFAVHDVLQKPANADRLARALAQAGVAPGAGRTVLVLDDDPLSLELAREALAQAGHKAVSASNARTALRLARTARPAAVVLDLLMPGMDGFHFLDQLRADSQERRPPVIVCTEKERSPEKRLVLSKARQTFAAKGSDGSALLRELAACLASAAGSPSRLP
jgi:PAS domain S-box-containing protein